MKLNGIFGKGSGKVGSSVFAVSGGEQIVRQYNPNVSNPSTDAQVEQRAKLKLMSQLAAAVYPVLAMRKQGLVSARNLFIKKNIGLATFSNGTASVDVTKLQITDSISTMADFAIGAGTGEGQKVATFNTDLKNFANRVVVCIFLVTTDEKLAYVDSIVENVLPLANTIVNLGNLPAGALVLAYGIKDKNQAATVKYENYNIADGADVATLIATNTLSQSDYQLTSTVGHIA